MMEFSKTLIQILIFRCINPQLIELYKLLTFMSLDLQLIFSKCILVDPLGISI